MAVECVQVDIFGISLLAIYSVTFLTVNSTSMEEPNTMAYMYDSINDWIVNFV